MNSELGRTWKAADVANFNVSTQQFLGTEGNYDKQLGYTASEQRIELGPPNTHGDNDTNNPLKHEVNLSNI
jgi:hypothetical protein